MESSAILIAIVIGCYAQVQQQICTSKACFSTAHRILNNMDPSVQPCNDFYGFACGKYVKTAVIPSDQSKLSSFTEAENKVKKRLKEVLQDMAMEGSHTAEPRYRRNLKQFYSLCMDEERIASAGAEPVLALTRKAGGWPVLEPRWNNATWNFLEAEIILDKIFHSDGCLFSVGIGQDFKDNRRRLIHIDQPGFGVDREYLVLGVEDPIVVAYYEYMVDVAVMLGADVTTAAHTLIDSLYFEISLAKIASGEEDRRDFSRIYNLFAIEDLVNHQALGWVDWARLLDGIMPSFVEKFTNEIVITEIEYFHKLRVLLKRTPSKVVANYMMWRALNSLIDTMPEPLVERKIKFINTLMGSTSIKPRWERCVNQAAKHLSSALSSIYVQKFFDASTRSKALEMTDKIKNEMIHSIRGSNWMNQNTKTRAESKAMKMLELVGYSVEFTDDRKMDDLYNSLDITNMDYLQAYVAVKRYNAEQSWLSLNEPVVRGDWRKHNDIYEVNAFYDHSENSIDFPAAILQPPFFSANVPWYVNYGAIGTVIGHEITHAFDDKGNQFNEQGQLDAWWDEGSKDSFGQQKQCMIDQYSSYNETRQTGLPLNGVNTQGENIADNGGLKIAFNAYQRNVGNYETEPALPGLQQYTPAQVLMLSLASVWCANIRTEALKDKILTGVHSPAEFRVNGVVSNFQPFAQIWRCRPGDPMNPRRKCQVW